MTFVIWGLWHGLLMMFEQLVSFDRISGRKALRPLTRLYTLLAVCLGFVVFRAPDMASAVTYIGRMFSFSGTGADGLLYFSPCVCLILLTGVSRMYLGVHTPLDVGVSLLIGTALVFALYPVFRRIEEQPRYFYLTVGALAAASAAFVLFVELHQWPVDIDTHNLASGVKNGYLLLGCSCGMLVAFGLERKYIRFDVKAAWWAQILKIVLGLALVVVGIVLKTRKKATYEG